MDEISLRCAALGMTFPSVHPRTSLADEPHFSTPSRAKHRLGWSLPQATRLGHPQA